MKSNSNVLKSLVPYRRFLNRFYRIFDMYKPFESNLIGVSSPLRYILMILFFFQYWKYLVGGKFRFSKLWTPRKLWIRTKNRKLTKIDADATMAIRAKPMKRDFIFEIYLKERLMLIGRCRYWNERMGYAVSCYKCIDDLKNTGGYLWIFERQIGQLARNISLFGIPPVSYYVELAAFLYQ